jgi:hypothetical protein
MENSMDNIKNVEGMTDEQFMDYKETLLKLVLEKLENSETLEEAKNKIEKLMK